MAAEVQVRLGGEDPELQRYRKDYDREFTRKWTPSSQAELFTRMNAADVILLGDFHALQQSQKTHLRVLKNFKSNKPLVLAMECFEAADQAWIDKLFAGVIDEAAFLKAIRWRDKWGFPFEYVRPLLKWAREKKIPVYGINRAVKRRSAATLKSRDTFAAARIRELARQHGESRICVIYGDLHLAKTHIPAALKKSDAALFSGKVFRLFQNSEKIYFQLLEREMESAVDIVKLSDDSFCLLNVPPWVKWQNYLMYLEQAYDLGLEEDDDDEAAVDYTDHIGAYVKIISEELGIPARGDDLSVYTAEDQGFWSQLQEHFSAKQLGGIEDLIEEETSFFLPGLGLGYLARPSVNHAATLAAKYVHAKANGQTRSFLLMPEDFLRQTWAEGIAYFGSKIINHKRKTDTVSDLRLALSSRGSGQIAKEPLMLALSQKMTELMTMSNRGGVTRPLRPKKKASYLIAARLLGGMMGERLYGAYRKKLIAKETLQKLLSKPLEDENFDKAYYEMMEIIESLPAPFKSKKEKM